MNFDKCEYNHGEFCVSIKCLIQTLHDYCILITRENKLFLGLTSLLTNENKLFLGPTSNFCYFLQQQQHSEGQKPSLSQLGQKVSSFPT